DPSRHARCRWLQLRRHVGPAVGPRVAAPRPVRRRAAHARAADVDLRRQRSPRPVRPAELARGQFQHRQRHGARNARPHPEPGFPGPPGHAGHRYRPLLVPDRRYPLVGLLAGRAVGDAAHAQELDRGLTPLPRPPVGRTVLVTGATGGLGEATARALAAAGAHVVIAGRNTERGQRIADEIGGQARAVRLDLADLDAIRAFADDFADREIYALVNNAGVMAVPRSYTPDGFEMQFG